VILSTKDVLKRISLSRTTLWKLRKKGQFPNPKKITDRRFGWLEQDIVDWEEGLETKIEIDVNA